MAEKNNLQNIILTKLCRERQVVTIFVTNGFQMRGRITAFDQHIVALEIRNEQQFVYKHAISTITPNQPIILDDWKEEPN